MRTIVVVLCAVLPLACAFPRSGLMMMPADRLGAGNAELAVAPGLAWTTGSQNTGFGSQSQNTLQFPLMEGNARYGLTDMFDVNLHLSAAGLEPGIKFGFTAGPLELAAMPSIGIGVYRSSSSVGASSSTTTLFNFQAGAHLMASHSIGGFFGIGYWFQYGSQAQEGTGGSSQHMTGHNLAFALGWSLDVGPLKVRPEVDFLLLLGSQYSTSSGLSQSQPTLFTLMPAITIALGTKKK